MAAFDTLQKAGFAGIDFPARECRIVGGLRDHVHEFPHVHGGGPEKLGRKLYEITISGPFHNTFKAYPNLWPQSLGSLRSLYEQQITDILVVPTVGTILAYCTSWTETSAYNKRSGVDVEFTFREDQSSLFLVDALVSAKSADISQITAEALALAEEEGLSMDAFDGFQELANDIAAIGDQVDLAFDKLDAKLATMEHSIRIIQDTVNDLDKPRHYRVLHRLHDIAVAAIELHEDIAKKSIPIVFYITPREMSVTEVSIAHYGRSDRAMEILQMNAFANPFAIPAGFPVRVYAFVAPSIAA